MAINGTPVQSKVTDTGGASTSISVTLDSAPTSGNLLVASLVGRSLSSTNNIVTLTGWTKALHNQEATPSGTGTCMATWWKVSDGTETTITINYGVAIFGNSGFAVIEYANTDLDLSSVDASGKDETNYDTDVTSQGSGSATNTVADALSIIVLGVHTTSFWDASSGPSVSGSYTKQTTISTASRAGPVFASKVLSATASNSATWSTTDTGSRAIGHHLIFASSASPAITVDDDTIAQDQTITITKNTTWNGSVTATLDGVSITLDDIDTTHKSFSFSLDDLKSGSLNGLPPATNVTLAVTDSDGTMNATVQFIPGLASSDDSGTRDRTTYTTVYDWEPASAADGDYFFIRQLTGALGTSNAEAGIIQTIGESTWEIMWYDVSGGVWGATESVSFSETPVIEFSNEAPEVSGGTRNELKWSNGFGNAAWTKQGSSTVSYGQADPGGGTDAWRVTRGTGAASYLKQNVALPTGEFVAQIKAKAATTGGYYALRIQGTYPDRGDVIFRLSDGVVTGAATASGSASDVSATSTSLGGGYYLLTLTTTLPTAFTQFVHGPCDSGAAVTMWEVASATASNADIADAQIEAASSAGPYVETEKAALDSNQAVARVVSDYNAIGYSNDLSAGAGWNQNGTTTGGSLTLTDGRTIYKEVETSGGTYHITQVDEILNVPQLDRSGLVTVRQIVGFDPVSTRRLRIAVWGNSSSDYAYWTFNTSGVLTSSTVAGTASLHGHEAEFIETVSGIDFYKITLRCWPSTSSASTLYTIKYVQADNTETVTYSGNGSDGFYIGYIRAVQGYTISDSDAVTAGAAELPLASAINTADIDGVACTVSSATKIDAIIEIPADAEYAPSGDAETLRWNQDLDFAIGDGVTEYTDTIQIANPTLASTDSFAAQDRTTYPDQPYAPTGSVTGDDIFISSTDGNGSSNAAAGTITAPGGTSWVVRWFDVSGGVWGAADTVNLAVSGNATYYGIVRATVNCVVRRITRVFQNG